MKRRDFASGKLRRPNKRNKISESLNGSPFIYMKFLLVWALVLLADFILEFRFEYLWPFWLLLRSVYDSFKYQGLAFSVFFVLIALTSDMICFLFVPVHWLFFAASTYVWVQYVWHTERGICLPTVSLWLLFVYIEASVRLRELKNLPFHLDLCRPFAAHCIGYPVVTLGFGFKSYVSYRMRLRKQKEVAKENEFYVQLLQKALPQEVPPNIVVADTSTESLSNGIKKSERSLAVINKFEYDTSKKVTIDKHELQYMEHHIMKKIASINEFDNDNDDDHNIVEQNNSHNNNKVTHFKHITLPPSSSSSSSSSKGNLTSSASAHLSQNKWNHVNGTSTVASSPVTNGKKTKNVVPNNLAPVKDDHIVRLESDIKRLKADLQLSRQCEMDLRSQLNALMTDERSVKNELTQLRQDNENLQQRLHNLVTARQMDKQTVAKLEKNLDDERKKLKTQIDTQMVNERKAKKAEEAAARAIATATRSECSDLCKSKRREIENDLKQLQHELKLRDDALKQSEKALRQYKNSHDDAEVLMSALSAMQEKNAHLEKSLSAETRLKLDLFSALDETKRQLEMTQLMLAQREKEIDELKCKIAEVMAVMPSTTSQYTNDSVSLVNSLLPMFGNHNLKYLHDDHTSPLDPNASIYTPKVGSSDLQ